MRIVNSRPIQKTIFSHDRNRPLCGSTASLYYTFTASAQQSRTYPLLALTKIESTSSKKSQENSDPKQTKTTKKGLKKRQTRKGKAIRTFNNLIALALEHPLSASNLALKTVASSKKMSRSMAQLARVLSDLRYNLAT